MGLQVVVKHLHPSNQQPMGDESSAQPMMLKQEELPGNCQMCTSCHYGTSRTELVMHGSVGRLW